jgi:hypothetical protein
VSGRLARGTPRAELPALHGRTRPHRLFRLGGEVSQTWMLGALLAIGVVLYLGSLLRLRRVLRLAD